MDVKKSIRILRIVALLLFITPSIGLLGSLIIHNYLVSFNFTHQPDYKFTEITPGISNKILCSEENGYCENHDYGTVKSLDKCIKYRVSTYDVTESGSIDLGYSSNNSTSSAGVTSELTGWTVGYRISF